MFECLKRLEFVSSWALSMLASVKLKFLQKMSKFSVAVGELRKHIVAEGGAYFLPKDVNQEGNVYMYIYITYVLLYRVRDSIPLSQKT